MSTKARVEKLEIMNGKGDKGFIGSLAERLAKARQRHESGAVDNSPQPTRKELEAQLAELKPDSLQARLIRASLRGCEQ